MRSRVTGRLSYANVIATLALVFALSGGALAASHYLINSTKQISPAVLRALRGRTGPTGPAGIQGPMGVPGEAGAVAGEASAYAYVEPPCEGCGELPEGFTPLVAAHSKNIALAGRSDAFGTDAQDKPRGTWCFILEGGVEPGTASVIVSAVRTEDERSSDVRAEWVPHAPDCAPSQIEIRTFAAAIKSGSIAMEPAYAVSFSFVVLSSAPGSSGGGTPPVFEGLKGAFACEPVVRRAGTPFELSWKAATDTVTPSSQIVYDIYFSHTSGGEDFSHATWITSPGVTKFETPALNEPAYFVVRARDQAGNEDTNTVELLGEDPCE